MDSIALNMDESALYYQLFGTDSSVMGEGTTEEPGSMSIDPRLLNGTVAPLYWEQYPHGYGRAANSRSGSGLSEDNQTMGYNGFGSNPGALTTPGGDVLQYKASEDPSALWDSVGFTGSPLTTEASTPPLGPTHASAFSGHVEFTSGPYTGGPFMGGPFMGVPFTTEASTPALGLTHPSAPGEQPSQMNPFSLMIQNRPSQPMRQDSSSESSLPPSPPQCPPDQQPLSPFEQPGDDIVAAQLMGLNIAPKKITKSPGNVQQSQARGPSSSPTRSPSQSSTDSQTPKYVCPTCGAIFTDHSGRTSLARHRKYGRKDGACKKGKIRCDVRGCGKEFRRSDSLTKHKRVHH